MKLEGLEVVDDVLVDLQSAVSILHHGLPSFSPPFDQWRSLNVS